MRKTNLDDPVFLFIPNPGDDIDRKTMFQVGDGFKVLKVFRPGFIYADGQPLKLALVSAKI